jgi:hypothetical protein
MPVQIRPSHAGIVAGWVGAVVSEKEDSVADDVFGGVADADMVIAAGELEVGVLLKTFGGIVGKDYVWRRSLGHC